jgi:hypothetical protein
MTSTKLEKALVSEVGRYLTKIEPEMPYWKGKHSWAGMVEFRRKFSERRSGSGFQKADQQSILKWGGINRFVHFELLRTGLDQLKQGQLHGAIHSRISSMSKLFSFYDPDKYFILDARVALTINHLIKKHRTGDPAIPFHPSRSKGSLVRAALLLTKAQVTYKDMGVAYLDYNSLVLSTFKAMKVPERLPQKPEIIEMALFSMALEIAESYTTDK